MKLRSYLGRAGFTAGLVAALAVGAISLGLAANITVSTGAHFVPTGPALTKGSDLNILVDKINTLNNGTITGDPVLMGNAVNKLSVTSGATGVGPRVTVGGASADTSIGLIIAGKGSGAVHIGGTLLTNGSLRVPTVTSSVNQVEVSGAVTSGVGQITIGGTAADTNAPIAVFGKGTGATLLGGVTTTLAGLQVVQTASRVNDLIITPGATGTNALLASNTAGSDTNAGIDIAPKGTGVVKVGGTIATCSGTTTATCAGQRMVVSVTGLTTAASTAAAAMTVTATSVASSSSIVMCQPNGYAGTGAPIITAVTPGTGSFSFVILNVSTGAALNATVPVACFVFGT